MLLSKRLKYIIDNKIIDTILSVDGFYDKNHEQECYLGDKDYDKSKLFVNVSFDIDGTQGNADISFNKATNSYTVDGDTKDCFISTDINDALIKGFTEQEIYDFEELSDFYHSKVSPVFIAILESFDALIAAAVKQYNQQERIVALPEFGYTPANYHALVELTELSNSKFCEKFNVNEQTFYKHLNGSRSMKHQDWQQLYEKVAHELEKQAVILRPSIALDNYFKSEISLLDNEDRKLFVNFVDKGLKHLPFLKRIISPIVAQMGGLVYFMDNYQDIMDNGAWNGFDGIYDSKEINEFYKKHKANLIAAGQEVAREKQMDSFIEVLIDNEVLPHFEGVNIDSIANVIYNPNADYHEETNATIINFIVWVLVHEICDRLMMFKKHQENY